MPFGAANRCSRLVLTRKLHGISRCGLRVATASHLQVGPADTGRPRPNSVTTVPHNLFSTNGHNPMKGVSLRRHQEKKSHDMDCRRGTSVVYNTAMCGYETSGWDLNVHKKFSQCKVCEHGLRKSYNE